MIKRFLSFLIVVTAAVQLTAAQAPAGQLPRPDGEGRARARYDAASPLCRLVAKRPAEGAQFLYQFLGFANLQEVTPAQAANNFNYLQEQRYAEVRRAADAPLALVEEFHRVKKAYDIMTNPILVDLYKRRTPEPLLHDLDNRFALPLLDGVPTLTDILDVAPAANREQTTRRVLTYLTTHDIRAGEMSTHMAALHQIVRPPRDDADRVAQDAIDALAPDNEALNRQLTYFIALDRSNRRLQDLRRQYNDLHRYFTTRYDAAKNYVTENPGKVIGGTIVAAGTAYGLYRYYHRQKALCNKQVNAIIDSQINPQEKAKLIKARKSWSYFWHWNAAAYDTETLARLQHVPTPHAHAAA